MTKLRTVGWKAGVLKKSSLLHNLSVFGFDSVLQESLKKEARRQEKLMRMFQVLLEKLPSSRERSPLGPDERRHNACRGNTFND